MGLVEDMRRIREKQRLITTGASGGPVEYLGRLVGSGKNYPNYKSSIPAGYRMSTAAEELAIQLGLEKAGQDPREAGVFDDLFGRNNGEKHMWPLTETVLRIPNGRDPSKYETDAQGRKYWAREVLIEGKVTGEILVPAGADRVVVEWDETFGIPKVTEDITWPHTPYTTHFAFNPIPAYSDLAVRLRSAWHRDKQGDKGCLGITADSARSDGGQNACFRPVKGPISVGKPASLVEVSGWPGFVYPTDK